jgi:flagellar biosynthesis/type III secretory pathway M-ring protein FliF/YscJ
MFVLGLLVLAAAAVAAVELVLANRGAVDFHMWNQTWHLDAFWLVVIGAAALLATVIALALMRASMKRYRRMRMERRELAEDNRRLAEIAKSSGGAPRAATARTEMPANYPPAPPADAGDASTDPSVAEEEHHGFFARHAVSGRRQHH